MDLFQSMRIFAAVVECGNFTKAADALDMTRPAVTLAIKKLESELGARLLQRTTRITRPTAEGVAFFERVVKILDDVAQAREQAAAVPGRRRFRGKLRVDIPVALARSLIPAFRQFVDAHPDVELTIGVSDDPVDLVADGVDCAVRIGALADSSLIARHVGAARLVTCAAPSYLASRGTPRTLDDLSDHAVLGFFSGRSRKMLGWSFVIEGRETTVRPKPSILVNNSDALVDAGLAGLGLFQALDVGVRRHLQSGALRLVLPELRTPSRPVSVLLPSKRHVAPQVRVFVEWVARLIADETAR